MDKKPTEGKCVVCGGAIVEGFVQSIPFLTPYEPICLKEYSVVSAGFYCDVCGLKYQHLPKNSKKEEQK